MAKLTRIPQKVFASQAGSNQIARFGSFAAGSPVLMGPSGVGSIQMLSQYESGWFASVVNGAAPAIEDMNALQYLYAYQLAYGFQEGIAEYDGSTTYFINSIAKSGSNLYISVADNNTGNAVSNTSFWKLFFQGNIFSTGAILAGTYGGDVFIDGDASLGSGVTVTGDLIVNGNLVNNGGYSLIVAGDLVITETFNFTPTDPDIAQDPFMVGGDWIFGNQNSFPGPSQFRVNKASGGYYITVGGDIIGNFQNVDCSGRDEASGLSIFGGGDAQLVFFNLKGGDSAGSAQAGQGGYFQIDGICNGCSIDSSGGDSGFDGFNAGFGGGVGASSFLNCTSLDFSGGSATTGSGNNIAGGGGGFLFADLLHANSVNGKGGDGDAGNGGNNGNIGANEISNCTLDISGGNSVSGNGADSNEFGAKLCRSGMHFVTLIARGGSGAVGGNGCFFTDDGSAFFQAIAGNSTMLGIDLSGGEGTVGAGGNAGSIELNGDLLLSKFDISGTASIVMNGGDGVTTGGDGGNILVYGSLSIRGTVSQAGGTGSTPGIDGTITLRSNVRAQSLGVANSAAATTPGSVVKKIEIFDEYGDSLGFIPVYDTIT